MARADWGMTLGSALLARCAAPAIQSLHQNPKPAPGPAGSTEALLAGPWPL